MANELFLKSAKTHAKCQLRKRKPGHRIQLDLVSRPPAYSEYDSFPRPSQSSNRSNKMMLIVCIFCLVAVTNAFVAPQFSPRSMSSLEMGYVPDGMTPEQYKQLKAKEKAEAAKKQFGAFGPQTFTSRSMQAFQKDLEAGKSAHLFPVFNAKEKLKKGEIKKTDIPYMQRMGGAWDNSDVGKAKKEWRPEDKKYQANAAPAGLDWSGFGQQRRGGPQSPQAKPNASNKEQPKPKRFGLF